MLVNRMVKKGAPMLEYRMATVTLSEPMKQLDAFTRAGLIAHAGCPVMEWQMNNVVAQPDAKDNVYPLSETARAWTSLWLTLQAVGWTSKMASSPSSHQVRVSFKNGKGSCIASLKPNPQFYEMIMGWPIGWTAPGAQVTGYAAWLRRSRGQFSRLLTTWTADT